jgi:hypothetical protein
MLDLGVKIYGSDSMGHSIAGLMGRLNKYRPDIFMVCNDRNFLHGIYISDLDFMEKIDCIIN